MKFNKIFSKQVTDNSELINSEVGVVRQDFIAPRFNKQVAINAYEGYFASAIDYNSTAAAAGIILSGMGMDGVKGAAKFKEKNFPVIVQNEESCLVYGMPKAVFDAGFATDVMSTSEISEKISTWSQI